VRERMRQACRADRAARCRSGVSALEIPHSDGSFGHLGHDWPACTTRGDLPRGLMSEVHRVLRQGGTPWSCSTTATRGASSCSRALDPRRGQARALRHERGRGGRRRRPSTSPRARSVAMLFARFADVRIAAPQLRPGRSRTDSAGSR
jgi:hypothetical protein